MLNTPTTSPPKQPEEAYGQELFETVLAFAPVTAIVLLTFNIVKEIATFAGSDAPKGAAIIFSAVALFATVWSSSRPSIRDALRRWRYLATALIAFWLFALLPPDFLSKLF